MSAATLDPAEAMSTAISDAYDQLRQLVEKFAGRRDDPQLLEEVGTVRRRALGRFNRAKKKAEPAAAEPEQPVEKPRAAEPTPAKPAAEVPVVPPKVPVPAAAAPAPAERVTVKLSKPAGERPAERAPGAPAPAPTRLEPGRHRAPRQIPQWLGVFIITLFVGGVALSTITDQSLWAIVGGAIGWTLTGIALLARRARRLSRTGGAR